jgi:hypothetical protein
VSVGLLSKGSMCLVVAQCEDPKVSVSENVATSKMTY